MESNWNEKVDLNDLMIFAKVAEHGSFTGAAEALGVARSSVCRTVARLEERIGVRLAQRDTRHFKLTDIGSEFAEHCVRAVAAAAEGCERIAQARKEPSGCIRVACPSFIARRLVSPLVAKFITHNPGVRIAIEITDREQNALEASIDVCIRMRQVPSEDSRLVMRSLGLVQYALMGSPEFLKQRGWPTSPLEAAGMPTLGWGRMPGPHGWRLIDPSDRQIHVRHEPVMVADEVETIRQAAVDGVGLIQLPLFACLSEIQQGRLQIVLPDYPAPLHEIQAVFPSNRGMLPAVRSFIDYLASHRINEVPAPQIKRHKGKGSGEHTHFWTNRVSLRDMAPASEGFLPGRSLGYRGLDAPRIRDEGY